MARPRSILVAWAFAGLLSPAHAADDVRLFAPVPQGAVALRPSAQAVSPLVEAAPDMPGTQRDGGPATLLAGTDASWPATASAPQENTPAQWQVVAQSTRQATAAPRSIPGSSVTAVTVPIVNQAWQIAPQALTTTASH